jgi:hypothetical protein
MKTTKRLATLSKTEDACYGDEFGHYMNNVRQDTKRADKSVLGETQKPCGDWIPRQDAPYKALSVGNGFASYDGVCYVCEKAAHVAVVEFIPARDVDRDGRKG